MSLPSKTSFIGLDYPDIDITNFQSLENKITQISPETIINCAAYTDVDGCETNLYIANNVNAKGPENLAKICDKNNIDLVHISTDYVFDGNNNKPYKEKDKTNPKSVYGDSKLKGELAIQSNCANHYIIRTSWLYGNNGNNFVDTMINASKKNKTLKVVNDQVGSPTFTCDLAKAILTLLTTKKYGLYHITNEEQCSWYDFTKEIFRQKNINTKVTPCTSDEYPRPAHRPNYSVLSKEKIKKTGILIRDWKSALTDYIML
jgi:dTDP-4-dehydrorhamnose reductase